MMVVARRRIPMAALFLVRTALEIWSQINSLIISNGFMILNL